MGFRQLVEQTLDFLATQQLVRMSLDDFRKVRRNLPRPGPPPCIRPFAPARGMRREAVNTSKCKCTFFNWRSPLVGAFCLVPGSMARALRRHDFCLGDFYSFDQDRIFVRSQL